MRKLLISIGVMFAAVIAFTGCSSDHEDEPELIVCNPSPQLFMTHRGIAEYDSVYDCMTLALQPWGLSKDVREFWYGPNDMFADTLVVFRPMKGSFFYSKSDSVRLAEGMNVWFEIQAINRDSAQTVNNRRYYETKILPKGYCNSTPPVCGTQHVAGEGRK